MARVATNNPGSVTKGVLVITKGFRGVEVIVAEVVAVPVKDVLTVTVLELDEVWVCVAVEVRVKVWVAVGVLVGGFFGPATQQSVSRHGACEHFIAVVLVMVFPKAVHRVAKKVEHVGAVPQHSEAVQVAFTHLLVTFRARLLFTQEATENPKQENTLTVWETEGVSVAVVVVVLLGLAVAVLVAVGVKVELTV